MEPRATETLVRIPGSGADQESRDLRSGDGRGQETRAEHGETRAQHAEADVDGESPAVSEYAESSCEDDSILRNEADAASDDSRNPEDQGPAAAAIVESGPQDVIVSASCGSNVLS